MMYASNDAQIFGLICSVYGVSLFFFNFWMPWMCFVCFVFGDLFFFRSILDGSQYLVILIHTFYVQETSSF